MQLILKRLAVWLLEMSLQALLLGLFLIVLHGYDQHAFGKDLLFYFDMIALLFFTTGYLLSTAVIRAIWKNWGTWLHPTIVAVLFLIHFEILNIGAGGAFEPPDGFRLRVAGVSIAFACTFVGGWFLRKWTAGNGPNLQHREILPGSTGG